MANTDKSLTTSIIAGSSMLKDSGKMLLSTTKSDVSIKKDSGKQLVSISKVGTSIFHGINKNLSSTIKAGSSAKKNVGKKETTVSKVNPTMTRSIGKHLVSTSKASTIVRKNIGKYLSTTIKVSATKEINAATLTLAYNGNAELGLGAQEGAQFNIIVTGTFTTFSITVNGKTLIYTENCIDQTITIDNINATVKNGTTNKLSKVTGDVADFLKLIPGDNVITYTKTGPNVDFTFDFSPIFI